MNELLLKIKSISRCEMELLKIQTRSLPVVLVKKNDGSPRLCIDYRRLNKVIIKDRYPLALIEDLLDRLQNAKIFSTIDIKNGFLT